MFQRCFFDAKVMCSDQFLSSCLDIVHLRVMIVVEVFSIVVLSLAFW